MALSYMEGRVNEGVRSDEGRRKSRDTDGIFELSHTLKTGSRVPSVQVCRPIGQFPWPVRNLSLSNGLAAVNVMEEFVVC